MPKNVSEIVNALRANHIAVRGKGDPNAEDGEYKSVIGVLFAVVNTLKMSYKTDCRIDGRIIGIAHCCPRHDYVEGCESSPVGYLEGIFVQENYRMKGTASSLCKECGEWAKDKGCSEFASD